ncbi:MAG: hypothetical protein K0Q95_437 [Bacteroidota bacterium]|jgi:hypothetical protein|nr:hypothetical protein [Bacteroidota bacterium]
MFKGLLPTLVFILSSLFACYSQVQLNDRIITNQGETIECTITEVKPNWIYYDHRTTKSFKNDYIHIDEVRSYQYNGATIIPKEYKLWGRLDSIGSKPDNKPIDIDQYALDTSSEKKDWHIGFLTFKNSPDTLFGWVKEDRWKGSLYEKMVFKKRMELPFETFVKDSLKSYQWGKQYFKYFRSSNFSKLIVHGPIDLYLGSATFQAGGNYYSEKPIDCLVLKKGKEPAVFIRVDETQGGHMSNHIGGILKDKTKARIEPLISDNAELLAQLHKKDFSYGQIQGLIENYNKWVEEKNNIKPR